MKKIMIYAQDAKDWKNTFDLNSDHFQMTLKHNLTDFKNEYYQFGFFIIISKSELEVVRKFNLEDQSKIMLLLKPDAVELQQYVVKNISQIFWGFADDLNSEKFVHQIDILNRLYQYKKTNHAHAFQLNFNSDFYFKSEELTQLHNNIYDELDKQLNKVECLLLTGEVGVGKKHLIQNICHLLPQSNRHLFFVTQSICIEQESNYEHLIFGKENSPVCLIDSVSNQGILVIDEIQKLSLKAQDKLAQIILNSQDRCFSLILLSSDDLDFLTRTGKFSEKLYQSINKKFNISHLSNRIDDLTHFSEEYVKLLSLNFEIEIPGIDPSAMSVLKTYPWPYNTSELKKCLNLVVHPKFSGKIMSEHLPDQIKPKGKSQIYSLLPTQPIPYQVAKKNILDFFNDYYSEFMVKYTEHNLSAAARYAGMDRSNFRRLFKKYIKAHDVENETSNVTKIENKVA